MSRVTAIPVRDANGVDLTIYKFEDRRFLRKVKRLKLDTGELVERSGDGFVIVATGERLTRINE